LQELGNFLFIVLALKVGMCLFIRENRLQERRVDFLDAYCQLGGMLRVFVHIPAFPV
jgi:hypothetical protein